jgi:hypothetical protein
MNPDKMTLEALARIKRSEPSFIEWLKSRYDEYCKNVSSAEGVQLGWTQGRMQEISQIIDIMTRAEKSN